MLFAIAAHPAFRYTCYMFMLVPIYLNMRLKKKICLFVLYRPTHYLPPTQKIILQFPEEKYFYFSMAEMYIKVLLNVQMLVYRLDKLDCLGKSVLVLWNICSFYSYLPFIACSILSKIKK